MFKSIAITQNSTMTSKKMHAIYVQRIKAAASKVSHQAPKLDIRRVLDLGKLKENLANYTRIRKENNDMMMRLNEVQRVGGKVHTFDGCLMANYRQSRVPHIANQCRALDKENIIIGNRLRHQTPQVECWIDERKLRQPPKKKKDVKFEVPFDILSKYSRLQLPGKETLKKLMRPRVFLDFYIKDLRPVGRVILKLFTEACPQVVLALVRACRNAQASNMAVKRIFPSLWMDFELKLSADDQINMDKIEYDKRALDHSHPGVLHFSRQLQRHVPDGKFLFSISSKPLPTLNGKRVAFGRVTHGLRVLECLQPIGMKRTGKMTKDVVITKVGVLT